MTKEEMVSEIDETLGKANVKLVEICGEKKHIEDVICHYDASGDDFVLMSGQNEVTRVRLVGIAEMKAIKRAIWSIVDKTRDEVLGKSEKPPKAGKSNTENTKDRSSFDYVMGRIDELITSANEKMSAITIGGFPYTFEDVMLSVDSDSAGIYIRSGRTPVCAVARAGNPDGVFREIKAAVWGEVDSTRTAVERRKSLKDEARSLEEESEKREKAAAALVAAGLSADILGAGCDPAAAKAVSEAAKKAVRDANRGLYLQFGDAVDASFGGLKEAKLAVRGFSGGIVILADGKPCMVSRFPKVGSNKTVDKTVAFIVADIAALGESRRRYLRTVQERMEREERLREIAGKLDSATAQLMSM